MKHKFPKKLKIGGHTFVVDMTQKLDRAYGDTNYTKNLIRIDKDLPESQKESVLLHEIFHCINTTIHSDYGMHTAIDSFAEQLYQVLKDNKLHF